MSIAADLSSGGASGGLFKIPIGSRGITVTEAGLAVEVTPHWVDVSGWLALQVPWLSRPGAGRRGCGGRALVRSLVGKTRALFFWT